jgi:hypothetical protein
MANIAIPTNLLRLIATRIKGGRELVAGCDAASAGF